MAGPSPVWERGSRKKGASAGGLAVSSRRQGCEEEEEQGRAGSGGEPPPPARPPGQSPASAPAELCDPWAGNAPLLPACFLRCEQLHAGPQPVGCSG